MSDLELTLHRYPSHEQIGVIDDYKDFSCRVALRDTRVAQVTIPFDHVAAEELHGWWPGEVLMKVRYRGELPFYGYVANPRWKFAAGEVTIDCVGPEMKLMHHYFRKGDKPVDEGVFPHAGEASTSYGFFEMIEAARLSQDQRDAGWPDHLLIRGYDFRGPDSAENGARVKLKPGDNVWESFHTLTDQWDAPDFEFEPIDETHDPDDKWADATDPDLWPYKPMVQMNLNRQHRPRYTDSGAFPRVDYQGAPYVDAEDDSQRLRFNFGAGMGNLSDFEYAQSLTTVRNFVVWHAAQSRRRRRWYATDSTPYIGLFVAWEASEGEHDSDEVLDAAAKGQLAMYGTPETEATMTLKPDGPNAVHYLEDFIVGDFCQVHARKGRITYGRNHRIIAAELTRSDPTGPIEQKCELANALTHNDVTPWPDESEDGEV